MGTVAAESTATCDADVEESGGAADATTASELNNDDDIEASGSVTKGC